MTTGEGWLCPSCGGNGKKEIIKETFLRQKDRMLGVREGREASRSGLW